MAIEILELDSTHEYSETSFDLDGVIFTLQTRYNPRSDSWYLSLFAGDGTPICLGRRITVNNILFPWLAADSKPAGALIAVDSQDEDKDPGEDELSTRVLIMYADADELVAMGIS